MIASFKILQYMVEREKSFNFIKFLMESEPQRVFTRVGDMMFEKLDFDLGPGF